MKLRKSILPIFCLGILVLSTCNNALADPSYVLQKISRPGNGVGEFQSVSDILYHDGKYYVVDGVSDVVDVLYANLTYEGNFGGFGSNPGQLSGPNGIYYNGTYFFVADLYNGRISLYDTRGNFKTSFGSDGNANGQLHWPRDVTSYDGMIFVADYGNSRVSVFNATNFAFIRNIADGVNYYPYGLTAYNGVLYVYDYGQHQVVTYDAYTGKSLGFATNKNTGQVGEVYSATFIQIIQNHIVINDGTNYCLDIFTLDGKFVEKISGGFSLPWGFDITNNKIAVTDLDNYGVTLLRGVAEPTNLVVTSGDYANLISWQFDQTQGATKLDHFNVYRYDGTGNIKLIAETSIPSYTDTAVQSNVTYTYYVESVSSIATSAKISSSSAKFEGPKLGSPEADVQTVTITGGSNDTSNGGFLSTLPVNMTSIVVTLIALPVIIRQKRKSTIRK